MLNEVRYGGTPYVVEKFGEPTAAIINREDFRLLQAVKQQQAMSTLRETRAGVRNVDPEELEALIEEARTGFHRQRSGPADAR